MYRLGLALFLAIAPIAAAEAQNMPVSQFLAKADALKKKGPLALFSGDIKVLKAQVQNSASAYSTDVRAARKAGLSTHGCPQPGKSFSLNSDELLGHFISIPPAERSMTVKTAFYGLMKKKFPCPA